MDAIAPQAGRAPALVLLRGARPVQPVGVDEKQRERPEQPADSGGLLGPDGDSVEISPQALARARAEAPEADADGEGQSEDQAANSPELSEAEQGQVRELRARDSEVRAHEQAHKAAGGDLASSPSYEYELGPDGNRYAVGGEVGISGAEGRTPQETADNARRVRSAALAPANPSGQDQAVAARASQTEARARAQVAEQERDTSEAENAPAQGPRNPASLRATRAYGEVTGTPNAEASASLLDLVA
jgi:SprA-related family